MAENVNTSRRAMMRSGLVLATAGLAIAGTARAQDEKIEQSLVQYQEMPKDGAECDKCVNWDAAERLQDRSGGDQSKGLVRGIRAPGRLMAASWH